MSTVGCMYTITMYGSNFFIKDNDPYTIAVQADLLHQIQKCLPKEIVKLYAIQKNVRVHTKFN